MEKAAGKIEYRMNLPTESNWVSTGIFRIAPRGGELNPVDFASLLK
jgi:hypothetical protein